MNHAASDGVSVSAKTNDVSSDDDHRQGQSAEKYTRDAGQKCQRNEHHHRRQRRADRAW